MFAHHDDFDHDEIPMWAWFLILPGLVIVFALLIRRMRSQARLTEATPETAQEFRLETSRRAGLPQQAEISRFAAEAEDTGEIARPVTRSAVMSAGEESADIAEASKSTVPEEAQVAESAAGQGDDLKIVEGIGPKIEVILQNAGITTFRQLANTSVEELFKILHDADLRLADPGTWPEQARLAANENWDFLKALQDRTKAGRRSIED